MGKEKSTRKRRPASTLEARETQLIALALDNAERKLRDGTASSQMICHFLDLASTKERTRQKLMETQVQLAMAKTEAIQSSKNMEEMYREAMAAFSTYSGRPTNDYD